MVVLLADGSTNTLSDGAAYTSADGEEDGPTAALFSSAELTIAGTGALTVKGNSNDGIAARTGSSSPAARSRSRRVDDGIRGKDYLVVTGGTSPRPPAVTV